MTKFNARSHFTPAPAVAETAPSGKTYEGAPGYARDTRSELFLLAVSNFVSENTFYEQAGARDDRFVHLVRSATLGDPEWTTAFLHWLRTEANMRTASLVGAAEFAKARLDAGLHRLTRQVIDSVIQRADEPAELLAYWISHYGRAVPKPVKRGIADAVIRLGTEFNYVKWDSEGRGLRFADVLNLTHPGDRKGSAQHLRGDWQHDLFGYVVHKPYQADVQIPETLGMLSRRATLLSMPVDERRAILESPYVLREAGMTWEALAGWLQGPMDAKAWECVAEGTPVWLPDGRTLPIEDVVREQLPVLSYDREWDMREPTMGRPYPPRDRGVGTLVPTEPTKWIDSGEHDVYTVRFASGRELTVTAGHRWAARTRAGSRRPLWRTTADLMPGNAVPIPLDAGHFGSLGDEHDGWFVGAMLGDGSMTGRTPAWYGHDDGTLAAVAEFAAKHGCSLTISEQPGCLRANIVDPAWHRNAVRDELIAHGVWGQRVDRKEFADLPYSRAFVLGAIAGLIDSDGSVTGPHVEFAVISERLARQFADLLLRIGVMSVLDTRANNGSTRPLWRVRVSDARSVAALAEQISLRGERKAARLAVLAERGRASRRTASGWRGYAPTIVWDRVVSTTPAGRVRTYCVEVGPSHLWIANGIVTGNCIIPSMGYMAQLRNLRNFDQAGVSDDVAATVKRYLADPDRVARSRQFPMRFLSAHRAVGPNSRWSDALELALNFSLSNVPELGGNTLVLVDRSGSMYYQVSARSDLNRADAAAIFGTALAMRCANADLVQFGTDSGIIEFRDAPLLGVLGRFGDLGGTQTAKAIQKHFRGHDRLVIITDEQAWGGGYGYGEFYGEPTKEIPESVPVYTWNVAGYKYGHGPSTGNRHTFGGLTDQAFRMIPLIEAGPEAVSMVTAG